MYTYYEGIVVFSKRCLICQNLAETFLTLSVLAELLYSSDSIDYTMFFMEISGFSSPVRMVDP